MLAERLGESWHENDVAHRTFRLRWHVPSLSVQLGADVDQLIVEVDVSPVESEDSLGEIALRVRWRETRKQGCGALARGAGILPPDFNRTAHADPSSSLKMKFSFTGLTSIRPRRTACPNSRDNGVKTATTVAPE